MPSVIDLGFSFAAYGGVISVAWQSALEFLGTGVLVVAPAGNQGSNVQPFFPAALSTIPTPQNSFQNVVAVASIDPVTVGKPTLSCFSNSGNWVTCSAIGRNVASTFLNLGEVELEDGGTPQDGNCSSADFPDGTFDFDNSWARWSGTSFATPKVVAAVCAQLAQNLTQRQKQVDTLEEAIFQANWAILHNPASAAQEQANILKLRQEIEQIQSQVFTPADALKQVLTPAPGGPIVDPAHQAGTMLPNLQ